MSDKELNILQIERKELIMAWLNKNYHLLSLTDKCRIIINMKGKRVVGEITQIPE